MQEHVAGDVAALWRPVRDSGEEAQAGPVGGEQVVGAGDDVRRRGAQRLQRDASVAAERAGTAAALLNTSRQTAGALSIAVFGALLAGDFAPGMRESLLLAACLLAATALGAAALLPRHPAPHG
ncbi:hypothetical protein [Streptomyces sp. NPDC050485]|uniref:hypothetical protein n=1 Tax=Streptomyces sp. NPDC050485 TaxID=3365617 RepID=UPI003787BFDB